MDSQGREFGLDVAGIELRGQASPREVESIVVRVEGQTGARPSTRTLQRVGRGTIGLPRWTVRGCARR